MTRTFAIFSIAAAAALAGCDNSDHNIVAGEPYDPMANAVQNLDQVELPPSIVASHAYRCADNSLVYVDWLNNDTARVKATRNEVGATVTRGEDGVYVGAGQTLSGSAADGTVTVNGKSCKR
jgi:sulfopyruvate decarboxylase TPP-binding subunit